MYFMLVHPAATVGYGGQAGTWPQNKTVEFFD